MTTHFPTVPVDRAPRHTRFIGQGSHRPLVLVVNDDPIIADTVAAVLNGSGLAALAERNARTALEISRLIPPEILIADISLRGMSGFDLALEITAATPDCDAILVAGPGTAPGISERMRRSTRQFPIMMKPVHPADLLDGIRGLLARRGHPFGIRKPFGSRGMNERLSGAGLDTVPAADTWVRARQRRPRPSLGVA